MTGKVEKKRVTKKPKDSGRKGECVVRKKREVLEGGEKSKQKRRGNKLQFTRGTKFIKVLHTRTGVLPS